MAVLAFSALGAAIGGAIAPGAILGIAGFTGASVGWAVGGFIGNQLFGPRPQDQQGPRLSSFNVGTAEEGQDIPIGWGTNRYVGQIIWAPDLVEASRTESVGGGKGLGDSSAEYTTYYAVGSWAVSFGEVTGILRRLWVNKKLYYDASSGADIIQRTDFRWTYYDGTQTDPDTDIEAVIGVGNVPAYTGQAVMVFIDQGLEAFGNRVPVVEAEIVQDGSSSTSLTDINLETDFGYVTETSAVTAATSNERMEYDPVRENLIISFGGGTGEKYGAFFVINTWSKQVGFRRVSAETARSGSAYLLSRETLYDTIAFASTAVNGFERYENGSYDYLGSGGSSALTVSSSGAAKAFQGLISKNTGSFFYWDGSGANWSNAISAPTGYVNTGYAILAEPPIVDFSGARVPFDDVVYALLKTTGGNEHGYFRVTLQIGSTPLAFTSVATYTEIFYADETITGLNLPEGNFVDHALYIENTGSFWVPFVDSIGANDAWLVEIDPSTGEVLNFFDMEARTGVNNFSWGAASGLPLLSYDPTSKLIWCSSQGNTCSFDPVNHIAQAYSGNGGGAPVFYHAPSGTAIGFEYGDITPFYSRIWFHKIRNVDQGDVDLADIVEDVCNRVGIESSELDLTALAGIVVKGFISNQRTAARNLVQILLQYALADGFESEWKIKFRLRGGASALTFNSDWIGAYDSDGSPVPAYEINFPHEIDLPRSVDLIYLNIDNDHQIGNALATYYAGRSDRKITLQMPVVMTAAEAAELADVILQTSYERTRYSISVDARYAQVEPADVVTIPIDERSENARVMQVTRGANGVYELVMEAEKADNVTSFRTPAGATVWDRGVQSTAIPQLLLIDTPLLRDEDSDQPAPYVGAYIAGADSMDFAQFWVAVDNIDYSPSVLLTSQPIVGLVQTVPGTAELDAWDDINEIDIDLYSGSLSSSTDANVLAGANAALWGRPGRWEVFQFVNATHNGGRSYTVSRLLRGRRGTDWTMASHSTNDFFVLLDANKLSRLSAAIAAIGETRWIRITPRGTPYSDVIGTSLTLGTNPLRPYSVIDVTGTIGGGGEIDFEWTRRTRRGGSYGGANSLVDGVGGSLSEDSEAYEIDVVNAYDGSILSSTPYETSSASWTYSTSAQSSDGADVQGKFYIDIYQLSAVVGRGYQSRYLLDRGLPDLLSAFVGLGAKAIFVLDDAAGATATEYISSSSAGTYTSASAGGAITSDNYASLVGDGSGYMKCGTTLRDTITGASSATVLCFVSGVPASGENLLYMTKGGSALRMRLFGASSYARASWCASSGSSSSNTLNFDNATEMLLGRHYMISSSCSLSSTSGMTVKGFYNGVYSDQNTWGTGSSCFASVFQDQSRDANYNDTIHASSAASPTGIRSNGLIGFVAVFDSELTAAQQRAIYLESLKPYTNLVTENDNVLNFTSLSTSTGSPSTINSEIGLTWSAIGSVSGAKRSKMMGCEYSLLCNSTSGAGLYRKLQTAWKVATLSISIWFETQSALTTTHVLVALLPKDWNGTAKKGVRLLADSSNGLQVSVGEGGGSFTTVDAATANITTGTMYHACVTIDATNGIKLYLNGSEIANNSASAVSIDWTDGASGGPDPATAYINQSTTNASQTSTNGTGIQGWYNSFELYDDELGAAEVLELYRRGAGVVV